MLTEPESVEPLKGKKKSFYVFSAQFVFVGRNFFMFLCFLFCRDDAAEAPTVIEKVDDEEDSQDEEEVEGYMLNEFGEDNKY